MRIDDILHIARNTGTAVRRAGLRLEAGLCPLGRAVGTVAINMYPAAGSWGGSSVFVRQFAAALRRCGLRAVYDLRQSVDVILVVDPRDDLQHKAFGMEDIRRYRQRHPAVRILHRINECDQRKDSAFMDELLRRANQAADHTVFISSWLRDYFISRWFDPARPHSVIYNGADPAVFHPVGGTKFDPDGVLLLVTHHWSANPLKGFPLYGQLDHHIADGALPKTELWVIGQWPADMRWRSARCIPPASGHALAALLRQCHAYVTASRWEPCGMHHVEGAQCGLPLLYHEDGGGIVEAGLRYGIGFREENLVQAVQELRLRSPELRRRLFAAMPDGVVMATGYVRLVQGLLAGIGPSGAEIDAGC